VGRVRMLLLENEGSVQHLDCLDEHEKATFRTAFEMLHWTAWEKGVKSLYYCRSKSIQRAAFAGSEAKTDMEKAMEAAAPTDYDECLACQ